MKLKKWLATALAVVMAVGTLGVFAACGDEPANPENPSNPSNPSDDTAIQYYLVGSGLGTLAISNWDQTNTDESLKFTRTGNVLTITAELYEGDQFQIVHNQDWAGQMGSNIVANEGKDENDTVIFVGAGGYDISNITVADGQSGKYELTVTLNSESDYGSNTLTWKLVEKYNVVFVSWYASDDTTEPEKTVVKKNTTTTARTQTTTKRFYEFDKWVTKDGTTETAFDFTQPITDSVDLYARYKESANANYHADTSTWKITVGTEDIEFAKNTTDYEQHNVYTASYQFDEGDEFVITNGTIANAGITSAHASVFPNNTDGTKYKANKGANYQFTLITDVDASGTVTVNELFFEELTPLYSGLAIVGGYANDCWNEYHAGLTPEMTETEAGSGIYTGTITTTTDGVEIKVATIVKGKTEWSEPNWGNDGGNYVIETAGTYIVTVNTNTGVLTVVAAETEYYIVGTFIVDGEQKNFVFIDDADLKLTKGSGNIYTLEYDFPNVATSFDWLKDGVFAFKVVSVLAGEIKDWYSVQGGDNGLIPSAGTYTITFDLDAGSFTFAPKAAN